MMEKAALSMRVITLEDSPGDLELIRVICAELAYPVELIHFTRGESLLDYLRSDLAKQVSFLLMDLHNPGMNGDELIATMRKTPGIPYLPTIIFSSSDNHSDIEKCMAAGANAFVTKPGNLSDFEKTICCLFNFWGNLNRMAAF